MRLIIPFLLGVHWRNRLTGAGAALPCGMPSIQYLVEIDCKVQSKYPRPSVRVRPDQTITIDVNAQDEEHAAERVARLLADLLHEQLNG